MASATAWTALRRKASHLTPYTGQFPARKVSEGAKLLEATAADDVCDLERDKRLLNGTQETVTVKEKIPTGASVEV